MTRHAHIFLAAVALAVTAACAYSQTVTHGKLPYGLRIDTNLFNVAVGDIVTTPGGTLANYATRADLAAAANAATNHSAANLNIAVGHADGLTNGLLRAAVEEAANVSTNWAASAIAAATNAIPGGGGGAVRPLPRYLHALDFDDSYPEAAAEYYRSRGNGKTDGGCSAVRDGGFLYRNFDYPFDERAEFVVRMSSGKDRFASVGVAQVGTNLTEQIVTSGKWSKWYKALPGATVDGINENGVCVEVNVVDGPVTNGWHTDGDLHPLAAVRWVLDNATNAQSAAEYLAAKIRFPTGWTQNFHYMVADASSDGTWIVENGNARWALDFFSGSQPKVLTNFKIADIPWVGTGLERFNLLLDGADITNAWYTRAYSPTANWASEFKDIDEQNAATNGWARLGTMEARRATGLFWQTVHTSVYDLSNRVLRVAVQETDDWYVFQVPASSGGADVDAYTKAETDALLGEKANLNGDPSENFAASLIEAGVLALGGSTITEESGGGLNLAFNVIVNDTVTDFYGNRLADKADREELERISPYILVVTNSIDAGAWGRIVFLPDGSVEIRRVAD